MTETARSINSAGADTKFSARVAWTFTTRLFMIVNSVVAGIIVARWLGVEGVGQLAVINVSVSTLVQIASLGLPSANTFFISQDRARFRSATVNSLVFALLIGGLLAVALSALAVERPSWFAFVSPELVRIAAISIPFQLITLIGLNVFLAIGNVREFNWLDLLGQSFVLINALFVLVLFRRGLGTLVTSNTAASVFVALLVAALLAAAGKNISASAWRGDLALLGRMLGYGLKFHVSILAGALIFRADLLVVNHFRGPSEAGVYSIASQVGMMLMLLPAVIATLLFPRVSAQPDVSGATTCQVTRHTAFVMLLCCGASIPLSLLLPYVYGAGFADATIQLWILLPGIYLVGLQSVLVQHFNAMGLPRAIPIYWIVTLAINVVLVFGLVPKFGARGAAVSSTLSYTLIFVLVALRFVQTSGRSFADIFLLRGIELRNLLNLRMGMSLLARGAGR